MYFVNLRLKSSDHRLSETHLEAVLRRTDALVHLGEVKNDFDSFFSPKNRKMEHRSRSRWSHGNDATGRSAEPHSLAGTCAGSPVKLCESLGASTGAVDRELFLISKV